jgi:membrane associated rhomboid family serine protease
MQFALNSPVVLTYALVSTAIILLTPLIPGLQSWIIAPNAFVPASVHFWICLFSHVIGHADWTQLVDNFALILLIGPQIEARHGWRSLIIIILVTSAITGILSTFLRSSGVWGSSGIAFMMILLSSAFNYRTSAIPVTVILIVALYIGRDLSHISSNTGETHLLQLIGGVCGSVFGYQFYKTKGRF